MSTMTLQPHEAAPHAVETARNTRPGLLKRAYLATLQARQAAADRQIRQLLANYTEEQLLSFGFSPTEVAAIRGGTPVTKAVCSSSLR